MQKLRLTVPVTEKRQIILARRGQRKFRERVSRIEHESHDERLDGENGLLLTPTVDHLFDRGFISFENDGELLISPVVHRESLKRMGIPPDERRNVGGFTQGQRAYLEFHREAVFLAARVRT